MNPTPRSRRHGAPLAAPLAAVCAAAAILLLNAGCAKEPPPKVVIIGLDGATWDLLDPWMEAGDLPNLKAFRDGAVYGQMNSVIPYLSPPAWTSAVTGVNPGRHGIYDFQRRLPGQPLIVNETSKSRRSPAVWNLLRGTGRKVALINIPMTHPPDQVDGVMVAGFPHLQKTGYAWPPGLEARLNEMGYILDELQMQIPEGEEQRVLEEHVLVRDRRWEATRQIYLEDDYDLFWVVFTGTDRIQHMFWMFDDPENPKYDPVKAERFGGSMRRFWIEQDRILGEFFAMIDPDSWVMLLSDHGFGPIRREFRLENWLYSGEAEFTPDEARDVFVLDRSDASRIYVREPGRDPGGSRTPPEVKDLADRLMRSLKQVVDPETGRRVVQSVHALEEIYIGKYAEKAPNVTLLTNDDYFVVWGDREAEVPLAPFGNLSYTLSGWHRMEGIYMLRGPASRSAGRSEKVYSLLDVTPTILYLLGQTLPEDFDGGIMEEALDPGFVRSRPAEYKGRLATEDRPLTPEERSALRNLPYIG